MKSPLFHPQLSAAEAGPSGIRRRIPGFQPAFTLVEVTIALGLVSFALLALLGLFSVGLSSSKESALGTAMSQIALHASSTYNGTNMNLIYNYAGTPESGGGTNFQPYFDVSVVGTTGGLTNASTGFYRVQIFITSPQNPSLTNVMQASKYRP